MHFSVAAWHAPVEEGSAAGRLLRAGCEGLLLEGHTVDVWVWGEGEPAGDLPPWCTWQPLPHRASWRMHARALLRPRTEVSLADWAPRPGAVALAEDPGSFPVLADARYSCAVLHYSARLDARALADRGLHVVQDRRLERRINREAGLVLAYSRRVADDAGPHATPIPAAFSVPATALPHVDAPVAAMIADWGWPANRAALARLLADWPGVRDDVPGATLLLAGRGDPDVGTATGVRVLGPVARSADVLADAALLAFPCPDTSGPKVKVLEAMALGVPVVTTSAGVEGLEVPADAAVVSTPDRFATDLVAALRDPARRAAMAERARDAVIDKHSPRAAARRRVDAVIERWPELAGHD